MKFSVRHSIAAVVAAATLAPALAPAAQDTTKGMAVAYPFAFDHGTKTSRSTAYDTAEGIARKAGYASVPHQVAKSAWEDLRLRHATPGNLPTTDELRRFAHKVNARIVLYGTVSWKTKSQWVGAGPKTISTAVVDVYVYSVRQDKVVFSKTAVSARSDERENAYKVAADILLVPIVSAVSGGPATPREQRAVQLALAHAYYRWAKRK